MIHMIDYMKSAIIVLVGIILTKASLFALPTESRSWTATNGKTVEGKVLSIEGGKAMLERADGGKVPVPLSVFTEKDLKFLQEHFKIVLPKPGDPIRSEARPAEGLAHPLGKAVGPISAGAGSSYFVYLPKSLKQGRAAPLIFYTNAHRGGAGTVMSLVEAAELCGWIIGASVESCNDAGLPSNLKVSQAAVTHIIKTLPVDPKRVYFTGNSGGAATAMANTASIQSAGAMPNVGYIPNGYTPPKGDYFVLGGGMDFNRYTTALMAKKLGKNAVHRMNPGGHGGTPNWQMIDGIIWLNMRRLVVERSRNAGDAMDFEASLIDWMNSKKNAEPHRVYSTARLMKDDYQLRGANQAIVDKLISELGADKKNVLYHEGLAVIDKISEDTMADLGGGSQMGHVNEKTKKAAEKEMGRFAGVPVIEGTLKAMASPTDKP